jgi:basic membrane protein A
MKKLLAIVVAVLLAVAMFAGCANTNNQPSQAPASEKPSEAASTQPSEAPSEAPAEAAAGYEIAMITDKGTIDDKSFNQGTWEGIKAFADANGKTKQYYKPTEVSDAAYLASIDLAVKGGAKMIVCPGFLFETAVYEAQTKYPDVKFILIDGEPHTADYATYKTEPNVLCFIFAEDQVGFYAGYAAVKDGFTKLGYQGGQSVPAVVRYGYGFVQGAEAAATEMGLPDGSISIMYNYSGDFAATPENQARAAGWYQSGTEIIFAAGGSVGNSVMSAAEASTDKFVIGVDVDQSGESDTVIASAMKMLGNAVQDGLKAFYDGTFEGGRTIHADSSNNGVGMTTDTSKWRKFTTEDYNTLFEAVKSGKYTINNSIDAKIADFGLKKVKVTEVTD